MSSDIRYRRVADTQNHLTIDDHSDSGLRSSNRKCCSDRSKTIVVLVIVGFSFLIMGVIGYLTSIVFGVILFSSKMPESEAIGLYPRESETREVKKLDGVWNFYQSARDKPMQGVDEKWYLNDLSKTKPTIQMPVPSSYNDITQDANLRDHVGTVWYDRRFFVPNSWKTGRKIFIRFESVHYFSYIWINGVLATKHEFGHLPFESDITNLVKFGEENRVTVLCDNVLLQTTIPQGNVQDETTDLGSRIQQSYSFDFFNYAGIHRSVFLYTTPEQYLEDIKVVTDVEGEDGIVNFEAIVKSTDNNDTRRSLLVQLYDKDDNLVANTTTEPGVLSGSATIPSVKLWWPYLMNPDYGYLYRMVVSLISNEQNIDSYHLKIGVRTLYWDSNQFLINNKPIYFHGFGKHEDSDIRGKGLDLALLVKDFNLLKWVGANAFRTSHYPYSTETMEMADENGIMIIDECASVDTENFSTALLTKHKLNLKNLITRDKNHPSVVMWSIANEPRTKFLAAEAYFGAVANFTKTMDPSRPITAAIAVNVFEDKAGQFLDIISFNRYNAWYSNTGKLDMIVQRVVSEAASWRKKYNKPVLMSEYGADTLAGLHFSPAFVWSEEFQQAVFANHFKAFDQLRAEGYFIGEFVWNFADFKTAQTITRVGGNKKGVFTRDRQPKSAAHLLRKRYFFLSNTLYKSEMPDDLFYYIIDSIDLNQNLPDSNSFKRK